MTSSGVVAASPIEDRGSRSFASYCRSLRVTVRVKLARAIARVKVRVTNEISVRVKVRVRVLGRCSKLMMCLRGDQWG